MARARVRPEDESLATETLALKKNVAHDVGHRQVELSLGLGAGGGQADHALDKINVAPAQRRRLAPPQRDAPGAAWGNVVLDDKRFCAGRAGHQDAESGQARVPIEDLLGAGSGASRRAIAFAVRRIFGMERSCVK